MHYAIADVAAFVAPGDPVDVEANRRGETLYGADSKIPLHPTVLSEGAASLLPDEVRPALLWTIKVDDTGEGTDVEVERALVRSRAKLSLRRGAGRPRRRHGRRAHRRCSRRSASCGWSARPPAAASRCRCPSRSSSRPATATGSWSSAGCRPVEQWNAQISLLTGMAAASLMVYARVGILRTLPPADPHDVQRLHRTARALGIEWPAEQLYPDFIRTLDPSKPDHAAMVVACTRLLRGAGYVAFNGELPEQAAALRAGLGVRPRHRAAAPARRPLRRRGLRRAVRRHGGARLGHRGDGRAARDDDASRAAGPTTTRTPSSTSARPSCSSDRVGERFTAVVVELDEKSKPKGDVTIQDPAIEAPVTSSSDLPLGEEVTVELAAGRPDDADRGVPAGLSDVRRRVGRPQLSERRSPERD